MVKFLRHPPSDLGYQGLFLFLLFLFPFYSSLSIFYFIFLFIFFHRARSWNPTQASTWKRANRDNPREPYGPDLMLCCGSLQQTSRKQNLEANLPEILGMILTVSKSNTTTDRILGQNIFSEDLSTFFWVDRVSTTTSKQVYFKIRVRVQSIGNKFSIMDGHFSFDCLLEQGDLNVLA